MNFFKTIFVLSATSFLIFPFQAFSKYTLSDAINEAKLYNKEWQGHKENLKMGKLSKYQAAASLWPVVSLDGSFSKQGIKSIREDGTNGVGQIIDTNTDNGNESTDFHLTIKQNLYNGGKTVSSMQRASDLSEGADASYSASVSELIMKIIDAYHGAILAKKVYEISLNTEKGSRNTLDQANARFSAGEITKTEVAYAKARLANAITTTQNAFGELQTAEALLASMIGKKIPSEDLVQIDYKSIDLPKTFEEFAKEVRFNNPSLNKVKSDLKVRKSELGIATTSLLPQVDFQALIRDKKRNSEYSQKVSAIARSGDTYQITVKVPLFDTNSYVGIKEAKHKVRFAEASLNSLEDQIEKSIVEIWSKNQTAIASIKSAYESVSASLEALNGAQQEYKAGTKTTIDLVNAEIQLYEAQNRYEQIKKSLIISTFNIKAFIGCIEDIKFSLLTPLKEEMPNINSLKTSSNKKL